MTQMPVDTKLHASLVEAVHLWMDYHCVGVDQKIRRVSEIGVHQTYEALEEVQDLDKSGLTTAMLLRAYVDWLARGTDYTVRDLLHDRQKVESDVAKMQAMIDVLERPEISEAVDSFTTWLRAGCEHYGMGGEELDDLLSDPFAIAYVRRDAIVASGKLAVHWFAHGEVSENKPQYATDIYQWWNVNSLLAGLGNMREAITLNLIRDAMGEYSYFAFGCRHGGNLLVLTDKKDHAHPLQKGMRRNPNRELERRAFQYRFPYHLLNIEEDGRGKMHVPDHEGLVPYNVEAIKLGKLTDLTADEMAWVVMMLELITEQHLMEPSTYPQLSYTGEMVRYPKLLEGQVRNLPAKWDGNRLDLPSTKLDDLTYEKVNPVVSREATEWSSWMMNRYADAVDENLLDVVGDDEIKQLPGKRGGVIQSRGLDPVEFGTAEKLQSDRIWLARYNQVKQVQLAANKECDDREEEVCAWFHDAVKKNADVLIKAVAQGTFRGAVYKGAGFGVDGTQEGELLKVNIFKNHYPSYRWFAPPGKWVVTMGEYDYYASPRGYRCCLSGKLASVFGSFQPRNALALAHVCGCEVGDLPDVLQHYETQLPYVGNSILSRLDPADWALKNPWAKNWLEVVIALSKNRVHRLRKGMGLPRFTVDDWKKLEFNRDW